MDQRAKFRCSETDQIVAWFRELGKYRVTVEATSCYEWFVALVEDSADRVVLAHPKKLRIIAESSRKTDKLDAQVLAEELAKDSIPEAWRMVIKSRRWGLTHERLAHRMGAKKAIVAIARRLLGVVLSMLRSGKKYRLSTEALAT